jgi:uncharacterized protein YabN with tetrapyrrole methylase and pyrophosphatase domain
LEAEADTRDSEDALGELLFAVAGAGRRLGIDPETALRKATARFGERFEQVRKAAVAEGVDLESLTDDELLQRYRAEA